MFKKNICILSVVLIILSLAIPVSASEPYDGYLYSPWNEEVAVPNGYEVEGVFETNALGIGHLKNAKDLCVYDNKIYVLDTGNNRIVVLNNDFSYLNVIENFYYNDKLEKLKGASGIFVNSRGIYIADTENKRILISDFDGKVITMIQKPKSFIYPQESDFRPDKLAVTSQGSIYCLINGVYLGIANFDDNFEFQGFLGSNKVELNIADRLDYMWKQLLTRDQKSKMSRFVPVEYSSMFVDSNDFIFTSTAKTQSSLEEVKKINPAGKNILVNNYGRPLDFGDKTTGVYRGKTLLNNFVDINVDSSGFINVLDSTYGRVFQYSAEADLIFTFGGMGQQNGCFTIPSAIASNGDRIYVLDSEKNNITSFILNDYGKIMRNAVALHTEGLYEQSVSQWKEVFRYNSYSEIAYYGLGKAYTQTGDYTEAMEMFELSNSKKGYSKAFKFYRNDVIRSIFPYIIFTVLGLLIAYALYRRFGKKKGDKKDVSPLNRFRYPFYILFHPSEGFEELKHAKNGSLLFANSILVLMVLLKIISWHKTGFIFNDLRPEDFNIFVVLFTTIGIFLLFVIANWSVSTLADGEGNFREIYIFSAYALIPYVLISIPKIALSHMLTLDEGVFITYMLIFAGLWTAYLLFTAIRVAHQYTAPKTVGVLLLTAVAMLFIVFIGVLMFSLFSQLVGFIRSIYVELANRFIY